MTNDADVLNGDTKMAGDDVRKTQGRGQIYNSILDTIGDTPTVRVRHLAPEHVEIYVKAEYFNPGGSVKDRLAIGIIEDAERRGVLKPGQTVIEATSGNTGVGLAMVCTAKGYPFVATMPTSVSIERRKLMRFFGAKVILTPKTDKAFGCYRKALELSQANDWFLANQFQSEANADIHENTTAREILADFDGRRLDYWVTGFGTGGTVTGVARALRAARPETQIVLSEPVNAQLLSSGKPQERDHHGAPASSHVAFTPHMIQGWTPDFIPLVLQEAIDHEMVDQLVPVDAYEGIRKAQELAQREGILTGISGGSTFAVSLELASTAPRGSVILCMLPDTGERYLSSPLFSDICTFMDESEINLSQSTPGYQLLEEE